MTKTYTLTEEQVQELIKAAKMKTWDDSTSEDGCLDVDGFAGGNIDDAYAGGVDSGYAMHAQHMCAALGIEL